MPIRINLLAEQQAAEEARRNDPVKRALIMGGVLVGATLLWTLMTYLQVKAKRTELSSLEAAFRVVDDRAKVVRGIQAEMGDIERRLLSLDRYSTNRVLWASMLDALQRATFDQIRMRSIASNQRYFTNPPTVFFTTNIAVPYEGKPAAWKFWASGRAETPVLQLAPNSFKFFTNSGPFATNKLPYTVKTTAVSTNAGGTEVQVKCEFTLPTVSIEDIEVLLSGGDYGNPPGAMIDEFARAVVALPYFQGRLSPGDERARFIERPPNPEPDLMQANNPMFKRFTLRLKYQDRVLTNE